ncbi:hypothetical protein ACFVS2_21835 [Brevibacillus sp. NPDC058079]|uniref:hypothetical protein n=1 Tax=Brevibacillus sp. NPDC058079 TaxID=3346330 RepID=UPI0036E91DCC
MKKTWWKPVIMFFFIGLIICLNTTQSFAGENEKLVNAWNAFIVEYRLILAYFSGFGVLTSILIFIYHMIQLGNLSSNPVKRKEAMGNIMISLICTSLLGGLAIITTLFYEILLV